MNEQWYSDFASGPSSQFLYTFDIRLPKQKKIVLSYLQIFAYATDASSIALYTMDAYGQLYEPSGQKPMIGVPDPTNVSGAGGLYVFVTSLQKANDINVLLPYADLQLGINLAFPDNMTKQLLVNQFPAVGIYDDFLAMNVGYQMRISYE